MENGPKDQVVFFSVSILCYCCKCVFFFCFASLLGYATIVQYISTRLHGIPEWNAASVNPCAYARTTYSFNQHSQQVKEAISKQISIKTETKKYDKKFLNFSLDFVHLAGWLYFFSPLPVLLDLKHKNCARTSQNLHITNRTHKLRITSKYDHIIHEY